MELYDDKERRISMEGVGLRPLRLEIAPPQFDTKTVVTEGPGEVPISRRLLPREMTAYFWLARKEGQTLEEARNELFAFIGMLKTFYISDTPGRQWKVYIQEWNIAVVNFQFYEVSMNLVAPSGVSESRNLITKELTGTGGIFINPGSWPIDPRQFADLSLKYDGDTIGASTGIEILNETNGTRWKLTGTNVKNDVVELRGTKRWKNGKRHEGQKNRELMTLEPGINKIRIKDAQGVLTIQTKAYNL